MKNVPKIAQGARQPHTIRAHEKAREQFEEIQFELFVESLAPYNQAPGVF